MSVNDGPVVGAVDPVPVCAAESPTISTVRVVGGQILSMFVMLVLFLQLWCCRSDCNVVDILAVCIALLLLL